MSTGEIFQIVFHGAPAFDVSRPGPRPWVLLSLAGLERGAQTSRLDRGHRVSGRFVGTIADPSSPDWPFGTGRFRGVINNDFLRESLRGSNVIRCDFYRAAGTQNGTTPRAVRSIAMPKLKVFRTPIGFHDAYIAAPSQKAALEAWGADANLFARGVAEIVTDPKLTKEPLANPGAVIRKPRGTAAEHVAALPKTARKPKSKAPEVEAIPSKPRPRPRPPSRTKLTTAEKALAQVEARHQAEEDDLKRRERALAHERQQLDHRHQREARKLRGAAEEARDRYQAALDEWEP